MTYDRKELLDVAAKIAAATITTDSDQDYSDEKVAEWSIDTAQELIAQVNEVTDEQADSRIVKVTSPDFRKLFVEAVSDYKLDEDDSLSNRSVELSDAIGLNNCLMLADRMLEVLVGTVTGEGS